MARPQATDAHELMRYQTFDGFYPRAKDLRRVYDQRFADPLRAHADRFHWDFWNVPGEYTVLRTPAYTYFPKSIYDPFHRALVRWGRENLGCHDISPPWLSCYINNCRQFPHQDKPHGPLAFVYSLTNWRTRVFSGGETFIVKPRLKLEPHFNRLTIFDPSLTHGVREVKGTTDPREGRLVIHGWFVNPRPFWIGPLKIEDVRQAIELDLPRALPKVLPQQGLLSLRVKVSAKGEVTSVKELVNTLQSQRGQDAFERVVKELKFPHRRTPTQLTLPFLFE